VDDVFVSNRDGSDVKNMTNSPTSWDEHGQFSPRGDLSFVSSRFDPTLVFPKARAAEVRTELYVQEPGGQPVQLTDMNVRKGRRVAVSDYDWDREGKRIIFQVAVLDGSVNPELWMIDVK
jgi:Tol biopolymer transport system component